jgi:hypothetical protein
MAHLTKQLKSYLPKVMGRALDSLCLTGEVAHLAVPLVYLLSKLRVGAEVNMQKLLTRFYGKTPNPAESTKLYMLFQRLEWIELDHDQYVLTNRGRSTLREVRNDFKSWFTSENVKVPVSGGKISVVWVPVPAESSLQRSPMA